MNVTVGQRTVDLEPNTWKVFLILNKLQKKNPVETQSLMAHMLFERGFGIDYGFDKKLTSDSINKFEKNIFKQIETLREHKLIQGTTYLSIPAEISQITSQLENISLDSDNPLDAMSIINMIIPHSSYSNGIFSPYDESIFSLYRSMGYTDKGILLKISFGGKIYSCIVGVKTGLADLYDHLTNLRYPLSRIGVKFVFLEKLPLKPITLFPFFTTASRIIHEMENEWRKKKFNFNSDEAVSYLKKWFAEYTKTKKQVASNVENYSLIDPTFDGHKEILVFLNKKLDTIATFVYFSEDTDKITINLVEKTPFLEDIPEGDDMPAKDYLISSRSQYAKDLFVSLGDPKASAIPDVGKQIIDFNKKTREPIFDTNEINKESFKQWIKAEIDTKRKLIELLQFENYGLSFWKKPIKVYASYKLDEQRPNIRRGGRYSIYYENSDKDEILIHELTKDKTEVDVYGDHISNHENFFSSIRGDLLSYLMEIKGERFRSYF